MIKGISNACGSLLQACADPAIKRMSHSTLPFNKLSLIEQVEREHVPEHIYDTRMRILHILIAERKILGEHDWACKHVIAKRVRAIRIKERIWVGVVILALGELGAVFSEHVTGRNYVTEGCPTKELDRYRVHVVEPGASLSDVLRHEISWGALLELLLVLEGIVVLRKRHGARLHPAVHNLRRASQEFTILF